LLKRYIPKLTNSVFIVAEIGVNHNGSVKLAKELVLKAKASGADAVKFQFYKTEELVITSSPSVDYQIKNYTDKLSYFEMLKKYEWGEKEFSEIAGFCEEQDIVFFAKGYLNQIDTLELLNVPVHKIDSASIVYYSLIEKIAEIRKPVLVSTGMSSTEEIQKALSILNQYKCPFVLLHCTSAYPTPPSEINLNTLAYFKEKFNCSVGLSDHSKSIHVPIAAVAMGAVVIEKHFTLDKNLDGPDHKASMTPDEFRAMVDGIREIELCLGEKLKRISEVEKENKKIMRRSLHFTRDIKKGERLTDRDIIFCRPCDGLGEEFQDRLIGAKLIKNVSLNDAITMDCVDKC
jgi:N,N'-diacetyllegionaminate synthase